MLETLSGRSPGYGVHPNSLYSLLACWDVSCRVREAGYSYRHCNPYALAGLRKLNLFFFSSLAFKTVSQLVACKTSAILGIWLCMYLYRVALKHREAFQLQCGWKAGKQDHKRFINKSYAAGCQPYFQAFFPPPACVMELEMSIRKDCRLNHHPLPPKKTHPNNQQQKTRTPTKKNPENPKPGYSENVLLLFLCNNQTVFSMNLDMFYVRTDGWKKM